MDYDDLVKVSCEIPDNKMCHIGDILICARNGSKRLVGKAAIIDKEGNRGNPGEAYNCRCIARIILDE